MPRNKKKGMDWAWVGGSKLNGFWVIRPKKKIIMNNSVFEIRNLLEGEPEPSCGFRIV